MPLNHYGVLKGRAIDQKLGAGSSPHYQVHILDDTTDYRIAVNVKSQQYPSELLYLVDEDLQHPILDLLPEVPTGFTAIPSQPGEIAVDFIRGNFFDPTKMRPLAYAVPGPDNDLNEKIDAVIQSAIAEEDALLYAFGERWGPEHNKKDKYFGFLPGNGIHDIHMNQGSTGRFAGSNGVWQDGALLVHFPSRNRWVGIFLAFQSQAWHTDDRTGHAITPEPAPVPVPEPEPAPAPQPVVESGAVLIAAALVNPLGGTPEDETVTLLNVSPQPVNLTGWKIADKNKRTHTLDGEIGAGAFRVIHLPQDVQLSNKGGIITLLDAEGLKVHGVSYTKGQAQREGWTLHF